MLSAATSASFLALILKKYTEALPAIRLQCYDLTSGYVRSISTTSEADKPLQAYQHHQGNR